VDGFGLGAHQRSKVAENIRSSPSLAALRPLPVGPQRAPRTPAAATGACEKRCGVSIIWTIGSERLRADRPSGSRWLRLNFTRRSLTVIADRRPGLRLPASASGLPKRPAVDACERVGAGVETRSMFVESVLAYSLWTGLGWARINGQR